MRKKLKVLERANVDAIIQYLVLKRIPYVRITNTGVIIKDKRGTVFGRRKHDQKGAPDIICAYRGVPIAIEVKSSDGKARPEQIEWLVNWQNNGSGQWIVASTVVQVSNLMHEIEGGKHGNR